MNTLGKTLLLSAGIAIGSSAATMLAIGSLQGSSYDYADRESYEQTGHLYTVANTVTPATDFTSAAESTVNGVVSIKSYATPRGGYSSGPMDPFEFFFGPQNRQQAPRQQQQTGLGSGVILSKDGYIVTNNHVIDGAEKLEVTLNDNRTFNAKVVGSDPVTDLALIKIDADDLHVIPVGDSESLKVGEWVLAVGNPFGFTSTVTTGIVSAKARNISSLTHSANRGNAIQSYIQTDAAVNPGNSGGALVNLAGELVGINTAIYSQTGNFTGYSFAIPTSIVKKVIADIKEFGAVQRAFLGVAFQELTPELAREKDITATNSGLYVARVEDRSAAFEAGLQEGDVIVEINGSPTGSTGQMQEAMAKLRPGDDVEITYFRDNKREKAKAVLKNNRGTTSIMKASSVTDLGCAFKAPSKETLRQLGLSSGVQVSGLKNGALKDAGVKDGFIITEINNSKVKSVDEIEQIYLAIMKSDSSIDKVMFLTGVYPTGKKMYYAVDLSEEE